MASKKNKKTATEKKDPVIIQAIKDNKEKAAILAKEGVSPTGFWTKGKNHQAQSSFFEPYQVGDYGIGNIRTISRARYGAINCRTLRSVAQKAWIINVCINHVTKKLKPYFKPSTDNNKRGFIMLKNNEPMDLKNKDEERDAIVDFICNTGSYEDSTRDDFTKYCVKLIRDLLTMDQIATEIQYDKGGKPCAFFAVDAATIERVIPDQTDNTDIKFIQIIDGTPAAAYTDKDMVFDYENPRTDIYHSFYGYSYVEQAVDLITSEIQTFAYNTGNFTENKLPRGMLLIEGDASPETVAEMEDYIAEIMSGGPLNQWRIPIIPSGQTKGEGGGIKWQEMNGKNRDMEFSSWLDFLVSAVVAIFGCSMDELGLQSQKSQNIFERNGQAQIQESKSLILGDTLSFLESYINKILKKVNPEYKIEFVGYENLDPKNVVDVDKSEVEAYKTLNEKREERGLDKLEAEWADIPLNPQAVQLYQAASAQQQQEGMEGGEDEDDTAWQNYGNDLMGTSGEDEENQEEAGESEEVPEEENAAIEEENPGMEKSLIKSRSVKIRI